MELKDVVEKFKKNFINTENLKSIRVEFDVAKNVNQSKIDKISKIISDIVGNDIKIDFEVDIDYEVFRGNEIMIIVEDLDAIDKLNKAQARAIEIIKIINFIKK